LSELCERNPALTEGIVRGKSGWGHRFGKTAKELVENTCPVAKRSFY